MNFKEQISGLEKKKDQLMIVGHIAIAFTLLLYLFLFTFLVIGRSHPFDIYGISITIIGIVVVGIQLIVYNKKMKGYHTLTKALKKQHKELLKTQTKHHKKNITSLSLQAGKYIVDFEGGSITAKQKDCYISYLTEQTDPAYVEWDDNSERVFNVKINIPFAYFQVSEKS